MECSANVAQIHFKKVEQNDVNEVKDGSAFGSTFNKSGKKLKYFSSILGYAINCNKSVTNLITTRINNQNVKQCQ